MVEWDLSDVLFMPSILEGLESSYTTIENLKFINSQFKAAKSSYIR
jgi:hypothetical protein